MYHISNQLTKMNTIHEFKTNFIENLEQTIFEITANIPLTRVYVSIGSKLNSEYVHGQGIPSWKSNALDQMFPTFLCTSLNEVMYDNNTLIIVIDKFTHAEYSQNEMLLTNRLKNTQRSHIVIFNTLCSQKFIISFMNYLTHMCKQNDIASDNLILCNYTKFSSIPNKQEIAQCYFISPLINKLLNKTQKYKGCLYEWLGYDYSMYNFICDYNKVFNMQDNNGYRILKRILHNLPSSHIHQTKISNIEAREFCAYIIDITKYSIANQQKLNISVYDHLQ